MSDLTEYFLNRKADVGRHECLSISHPAFSKVYNVVRNPPAPYSSGLTAEGTHYEYYPLDIKSIGFRPNLDSGFRINLGDLGEIVPTELDLVAEDDTFSIKPTVIWRMYRSDDLAQPIQGPLTLEASQLSFKAEGCSFEAKAPSVNNNRTGELYNTTRFPMLAGVMK